MINTEKVVKSRDMMIEELCKKVTKGLSESRVLSDVNIDEFSSYLDYLWEEIESSIKREERISMYDF